VYFTEAHERLVPLGTFILVSRQSIRHFGIGCTKNWLRGSLRYPDDAEPDDDDHQYHVYVSVRIRNRSGDNTVRVIHVHLAECRIMEGSNVAAVDISLDACPVIVQMNAGVQP
jgi:hypothetical protein